VGESTATATHSAETGASQAISLAGRQQLCCECGHQEQCSGACGGGDGGRHALEEGGGSNGRMFAVDYQYHEDGGDYEYKEDVGVGGGGVTLCGQGVREGSVAARFAVERLVVAREFVERLQEQRVRELLKETRQHIATLERATQRY
jgi:hypothetical protein